MAPKESKRKTNTNKQKATKKVREKREEKRG